MLLNETTHHGLGHRNVVVWAWQSTESSAARRSHLTRQQATACFQGFRKPSRLLPCLFAFCRRGASFIARRLTRCPQSPEKTGRKIFRSLRTCSSQESGRTGRIERTRNNGIENTDPIESDRIENNPFESVATMKRREGERNGTFERRKGKPG